ncbi:MAG: hypothetical protein JO354_06905 [Verrucomicrobia bacterium]|nr:hypothetical protein [Verrucomicrobiota bacterium]
MNRCLPRVLFGLYLIMLQPLMAAEEHCTFRVHAQANENDGDVFASPVTMPISGKQIFVEKIPVVSEHDVAAFRAMPAADGSFGALIELNEHGRLALEAVSTEHRGSTLLVLVNGRAVTELLVDRAVSDGRIYLPSGLARSDIEIMNKDWPQIGRHKHR